VTARQRALLAFRLAILLALIVLGGMVEDPTLH
jgi:hypothetical protein